MMNKWHGGGEARRGGGGLRVQVALPETRALSSAFFL